MLSLQSHKASQQSHTTSQQSHVPSQQASATVTLSVNAPRIAKAVQLVPVSANLMLQRPHQQPHQAKYWQ